MPFAGITRLPAGRHGLSRSFVVTNQRERMLAAVADAVAEKGFARFTVEDVVRLAGVSRRTFYDHFSDKREAFFAAYDASVVQTMRVAAESFAGSEEWPEQVRFGLHGFLSFLANDPSFAHLGIIEMPLAGPEGRARHLAARSGFEVFLAPGAALAAHDVPAIVPRTIGTGVFTMVYSRIASGEADRILAALPVLVFHALAPYLGVGIAGRGARAARAMIA